MVLFFKNSYLLDASGQRNNLQQAGSSLHHGRSLLGSSGSLVMVGRLRSCGAWAPEHTGSVVVA